MKTLSLRAIRRNPIPAEFYRARFRGRKGFRPRRRRLKPFVTAVFVVERRR
jgi:hypothetical protein